jgi:hypothetical protein
MPITTIAQEFSPTGSVTDVRSLGNGNINDTFLVTGEAGDRFVLQRINTQVFRHPQWVMENMKIVTEHIHSKLRASKLQGDRVERRWETPRVILTNSGADHFVDETNSFWRAISFIDQAETIDRIEDPSHAIEVGIALGTFHELVGDISAATLHDTLEGFHLTPEYLKQYHEVIFNSRLRQTPEIDRCLQWVSDRTSFVTILEDAKRSGKLTLRIMHGDPKVNNVMFDSMTHKAISMVDLDTVKPGLIHYDIGDCLRSGCNMMGEEAENWEAVQFDIGLCETILQGYLPQVKVLLTNFDYDFIYDSIRLITFELGLRFLTDYLAGNTYFKVNYPSHNLQRAMVQFQLMESLERQEDQVRTIIEGHKKNNLNNV